MVKTISASEVADLNYRLGCVTVALRSIWEVMECGGCAAEDYMPGLGCIVNALYGLSDELTELTGERRENSKAPSE